MLNSTTARAVGPAFSRAFSRTAARQRKVTVVGAAGGIGQPLSLLLKLNPDVTELRLYDLAPFTPGVGADIGHINTKAKVTAFVGGADQLALALKDSEVVVVPAGVPRKPGMTRDDLFNTNASIVAGIADGVAENCPDAALCIISNPVNSTVPICAEVLKNHGKYNPKKLFGVTTLDVVRAEGFVADNQGTDPTDTQVRVVGGHAGITILPLLSQIEGATFSDADRDALTHRVMFGGDEVVQAKAGAGSATLSMAYAGAKFAGRVISALNGAKGVVECTFVESSVTSAPFFASPVELGPDGVANIHGVGDLSEFEQQKLDELMPDLTSQIAKGVEWVKENRS